MKNESSAEKLQNELLEKGFKAIELCYSHDDGMVSIIHHVLSKDDEPSENIEPCLDYKRHDLSSDEARSILKKWMDQVVIFPDPRVV